MLPRIILRVNGTTQTETAPPPPSSTLNHTGLTIKLPSLKSLRHCQHIHVPVQDQEKSIDDLWEDSSDGEEDFFDGENDNSDVEDERMDEVGGEYADLRRLVDIEAQECAEYSQDDAPDWQVEDGEKRSTLGNILHFPIYH